MPSRRLDDDVAASPRTAAMRPSSAMPPRCRWSRPGGRASRAICSRTSPGPISTRSTPRNSVSEAMRFVATLRDEIAQATAIFRAEPALPLTGMAPLDRGRHGRHARSRPRRRASRAARPGVEATGSSTFTSGGTGRTGSGGNGSRAGRSGASTSSGSTRRQSLWPTSMSSRPTRGRGPTSRRAATSRWRRRATARFVKRSSPGRPWSTRPGSGFAEHAALERALGPLGRRRAGRPGRFPRVAAGCRSRPRPLAPSRPSPLPDRRRPPRGGWRGDLAGSPLRHRTWTSTGPMKIVIHPAVEPERLDALYAAAPEAEFVNASSEARADRRHARGRRRARQGHARDARRGRPAPAGSSRSPPASSTTSSPSWSPIPAP